MLWFRKQTVRPGWSEFGALIASAAHDILNVNDWSERPDLRTHVEATIKGLYSVLAPSSSFVLSYSDAASTMIGELYRGTFVIESGFLQVELSGQIYNGGRTGQATVQRMITVLPIIARVQESIGTDVAEFTLALGDHDYGEHAAFCSANPNCLLLPDSDFLLTGGYRAFREALTNVWIDWELREAIVFWRGSSTGVARTEGSYDPDAEPFKVLPRLEMCHRLNRLANCDVGLTAIDWIGNERTLRLAKEQLSKPWVEKLDQMRFRYLIDIDGMANAWSAPFLAMTMSACIVKIASPHHFQQWYYGRRLPWEHFIPVSTDLSDLESRVEWALSHPKQSAEIAQNGRNLAAQLPYELEVEAAARRLLRLPKGNKTS
jgi:hypothetical protein